MNEPEHLGISPGYRRAAVLDAISDIRRIRRYIERSSLTMRDYSELSEQFDAAERHLERAMDELREKANQDAAPPTRPPASGTGWQLSPETGYLWPIRADASE